MATVARRYKILLEKDPKGGYTVTVPALPGCVTEGETVAEAVDHAKEAIQGFLEALALKGLSAPEDETVLIEVQV